VGQEKISIWKVILIAFIFFGVAGLLSAFVAPIENQMWAGVRKEVLNNLPIGFDWMNFEFLKSFSKPKISKYFHKIHMEITEILTAVLNLQTENERMLLILGKVCYG